MEDRRRLRYLHKRTNRKYFHSSYRLNHFVQLRFEKVQWKNSYLLFLANHVPSRQSLYTDTSVTCSESSRLYFSIRLSLKKCFGKINTLKASERRGQIQ